MSDDLVHQHFISQLRVHDLFFSQINKTDASWNDSLTRMDGCNCHCVIKV